MISALYEEAGNNISGLETIIAIARFCTHSSSETADFEKRSVILTGKDGRESRLLKTPLNNPHTMLFTFRLSFTISQKKFKIKTNVAMILNCGIPAIVNALEMKDVDKDGKFMSVTCN